MVAPPPSELDRTFAALAHPTRRAILTRLAREGEATVTELAEPFDVSLMAISKHLKVMAEAGLVARERDGRVRRCSFDPEPMARAAEWIEVHRRYWAGQLDALADFFDTAAEPSERETDR